MAPRKFGQVFLARALKVWMSCLVGGSYDSLFCRHISSLSPSFDKDRLAEETLRLPPVLVPRLIEGSGWVFEPQPSILQATPSESMLPSDVREMILRRLTRLSSPARTLLAAGAALGHDFTFEELCQIAQLTAQDGLVALDEALQNLLLQESSHRREGRSGVSYHFAHDKIREVVYAASGDARRRVFHGRSLTVPGHVDAPAAELASHVLANGSAALTFR